MPNRNTKQGLSGCRSFYQPACPISTPKTTSPKTTRFQLGAGWALWVKGLSRSRRRDGFSNRSRDLRMECSCFVVGGSRCHRMTASLVILDAHGSDAARESPEAHGRVEQTCLRGSRQLTRWHNRVVGLVTECWIERRMQRSCILRVKLEVILHGIRRVRITRRNSGAI